MNKNKTKVSVIMNCLNGEKFLKEAINSVIYQTYDNWELIFLDNCSTDNSINIAKSYKNRNIKIYSTNKYLICGEARNFAITKSTGEYIAFLDSDDIWYKDKLEKQINYIEKNKIKILYCNAYIKKDNLRITSKKKLPEGVISKNLLHKNPITFSSVIIDSKIFFSKNFRFQKYEIIEDFDLFFRLSKNFKFYALQEPLVIYREHQNMISKKKFELYIKELDDWAEVHKAEIDKKDFIKMKNEILYNKISINLKNGQFEYFFDNIRSIQGYMLILKLLLKFIIQKIKI